MICKSIRSPLLELDGAGHHADFPKCSPKQTLRLSELKRSLRKGLHLGLYLGKEDF